MSDHHRRLLRELGREALAIVRERAAATPEERAAGARRWEELSRRASVPAGDGFRQDLHGILEQAVSRLESPRSPDRGP
jgi:hypothetical protein